MARDLRSLPLPPNFILRSFTGCKKYRQTRLPDESGRSPAFQKFSYESGRLYQSSLVTHTGTSLAFHFFDQLCRLGAVDKEFKILIADRNRNVRNLLQRELFGEGYQVILAGEDREIIRLLHDEKAIDLLILDPDIPSALSIADLIRSVHVGHPALPIVIYTFLNDEFNYLDLPGVALRFEKGEDISLLREVITDVIKKYYPTCPS
jgi:CheY-like chemotaxis protein